MHVDLLRPNARHEAFREAAADAEVAFLFTADRYALVGDDDELRLVLEVRRAGAPMPFVVREAAARVTVPARATPPRAPIRFVAEGDRQTARFRPADVAPPAAPAIVTVAVAFDYGAASLQRAALNVHFTPSAAVPARFTGAFDDAVEEGSLVVRAGLEVREPGRYVVDANLWDARGEPVAWARYKGELLPGEVAVPLAFFGKAILDAEPTPPFRLGELRGARIVLGGDPDLATIPPYEGSYTTRTASLEDLSSAEWDAPQKQATVRALGAMMAMPGAPTLAAARAAP